MRLFQSENPPAPIEQPSMVKMVAMAGPDYEEGPNSQVKLLERLICASFQIKLFSFLADGRG